MLVSYASSNWSIMGWEEKSLLARTELFKSFVIDYKNDTSDDVVFIDVTYDKELRPVYETSFTPDMEELADHGRNDIEEEFQKMPLGNNFITDRGKLLQLLQILKEKDDYKFILLDIAFSNEIDSSPDSLLFATIASMRDIIIPRHAGMVLADPVLYDKSGMADYSTLYIESDFIKFPYFFDGQKSIPLLLYETLYNVNVNDHKLYATDNGRLARKSIPLTLDFRMNRNIHENEGNLILEDEMEIPLMGRDILGVISCTEDPSYSWLDDDPDMFKGKLVVIGSLFGDDNHSTYVGEMPGCLILYNAYLSLKKGRHLMTWPLILVLFLIFFLLSFTILKKDTLVYYIQEQKRKSTKKWLKNYYKVIKILIANFAIEFILAFICVIIYLISGEIYDIVLTGIYFILVAWIIKKRRIISFLLKKFYRVKSK